MIVRDLQNRQTRTLQKYQCIDLQLQTMML
jgi:hypothetical protein